MIRNHIKDFITRYRAISARKMRSWEIRIYEHEYILLNIPKCMFHPDRWKQWGRMQAELLFRIQKHWESTYIYIRFATYSADYYTKVLSGERFEEIDSEYKEKGERTFLFPDCRDQKAIEVILSSDAINDVNRTVVIMDHQPSDWREVLKRLYNVAFNLYEMHSIKEFKDDLLGCKCLCYTIDHDLLIAKIDLDESIVLDIATDLAQEEDLELVITRELEQSKGRNNETSDLNTIENY